MYICLNIRGFRTFPLRLKPVKLILLIALDFIGTKFGGVLFGGGEIKFPVISPTGELH
ncbi:hypothetical protein CSCA_2596 [Clostridium scatologenes]|uniref:Uncharacterized protein n=1 Tax=Clostridium scatologenes TaxID=1548 RepID=A0A0E3GR53_CLOSL|nr:hypothetical protein CSCA_2596 [Clostridium scatologenes]